MNCKLCNSINLEIFLDLGLIPIVDKFVKKEQLNDPEIFYPLNVHLCKDCGLAQLGFLIPADKLFNQDYPYDSRVTKFRQQSYKKLADYVCKKYSIPKNSLVVDIGSNTGLLLECFKKNKMDVIGIEPSKNVAEIAISTGINTKIGFLGKKIAEAIISKNQKAMVVTATNVFAHIQDYNEFAESLKKILSDEGIFIVQVPHFLQLINNLEYDTVYHEHVSYFGLKPLIQYFSKIGMEIFEVLEEPIDGGSIRCFIGKKGKREISNSVKKIQMMEEDAKIYSIERLRKFAIDVKHHKENLQTLLLKIKGENKRIVGISAPAKGIVLLSYCKIDNDILDYVTEKDQLKIGKYTSGFHIPVKTDKFLIEDKPDYGLILAWNFSDEIIKNLGEFQKNGGKFIIPIPSPKILE